MKITQVCEGCGEEFIAHHGLFCMDCAVVRIDLRRKPATVLRQGNERNLESKQRERNKRRGKYRKKDVT